MEFDQTINRQLLIAKQFIQKCFKNIIVLSLFVMLALQSLPANAQAPLLQTMTVERTLSIIKPDAVAKNLVGKINTKFEDAGLKIIAAKMIHLTKQQAEGFYDIHRGRPFFNDLVAFMISGPVLVQVLEGDNAVLKNREIMGATNPKDAAPGTIRRDFATSISENAVHGSDSLDNAGIEIKFFFTAPEICERTR